MNETTTHEFRQSNQPPRVLPELHIRIVDSEGRVIQITGNEEGTALEVQQQDGSGLDASVIIINIIDAIGELNAVLEGLREDFPGAYPVTN